MIRALHCLAAFSAGLASRNPEEQIDGILEIEQEVKIKHMPPEKQVVSISVIFDKADSNGNGTLEYEEIHQWMHRLERHIVNREVKRNFGIHDKNKDGFVEEEELINGLKLNENSEADKKAFRDEIERFRAADFDHDFKLTGDEFEAFIFPRNFNHTKYIYTKEVMEHFDTDEDGVITFDEYIIPHGLDIEDLSEENKLRLDIERRSFD